MLEDQIRKNILNSFTQSEVEKGVYTDNWLNRKLGRVGKEYTKKEGNKKEKDNLINSKSDYPFMHLLYSQLLVCQRVCLQNTVCLICK